MLCRAGVKHRAFFVKLWGDVFKPERLGKLNLFPFY